MKNLLYFVGFLVGATILLGFTYDSGKFGLATSDSISVAGITVSTMTASSMTVTNISAAGITTSTITASSGTITSLAGTGVTVTTVTASSATFTNMAVSGTGTMGTIVITSESVTGLFAISVLQIPYNAAPRTNVTPTMIGQIILNTGANPDEICYSTANIAQSWVRISTPSMACAN